MPVIPGQGPVEVTPTRHQPPVQVTPTQGLAAMQMTPTQGQAPLQETVTPTPGQSTKATLTGEDKSN